MAILRSLDGRYYEIPDDQVAKFLIPEDKLKDKLQSSGPPAGDSGPPPGGPSVPPSILVQIYGIGPAGAGGPPPGAGAAGPPPGAEVSPYEHHWYNHWHNWYNHWHNWHHRD